MPRILAENYFGLPAWVLETDFDRRLCLMVNDSSIFLRVESGYEYATNIQSILTVDEAKAFAHAVYDAALRAEND